MEELKEKIEKFIADNKLEFEGVGSGLNGNCVILAGFLCHALIEKSEGQDGGIELIYTLALSPEAETELLRVFDFAWWHDYEDFWATGEAKEQYVF